jgi:type III secretion system YscQ/HrcQ family protein
MLGLEADARPLAAPPRAFQLLDAAELAGAPSWGAFLPRAGSAELGLAELARAASKLLDELPAGFVAAAEEAIAEVWGLPLSGPAVLEVVLSQGGIKARQRLDLPLGEKPIKLGSGAACHLRLRELELAAEHCELKQEKGQLSLADLGQAETRVNGQVVKARSTKKLAAGDVVEAGKLRLELGHLRAPETLRPVHLRVVAARALLTEEPFAELGGQDEIWLPVRAGTLAGYLRVPETWLAHAYHALGWQPPELAIGLANPVDRAITAFAWNRIGAALAAKSRLALEVGPPVEAPTCEKGAAPHQRWFFVALEIAFRERALPATFVWPAPPPGKASARPLPRSLGRLRLPVAVRAAELALTVGELASVGRGDVLVPPTWLGRAKAEAGGALDAGRTRLRVQNLERAAELSWQDGVAHLELGAGRWTLLPKGETSMLSETPKARAPEAESNPTSGTPIPPAGLPAELEVMVSFELDRLNVPLADLLSWQEGSALRLDRTPDQPVRILVHDAAGARVLGTGRVLVIEDRVGVAIEEWWAGNPEGDA